VVITQARAAAKGCTMRLHLVSSPRGVHERHLRPVCSGWTNWPRPGTEV